MSARRRLVWVALAAVTALPGFAQGKPASSAAAATRGAVLRSGSIPTRDGLQLVLNADSGNVRVVTDAVGEVRYRVRAETDANSGTALQKEFSLRARSTARGVELDGRIPAGPNLGRIRLSYEVHVPRRYNLTISTRAGDIAVPQNIDGRVALTTGGGNIQAGRIGGANAHGELAARLETGGGHILVGDVGGSLRASTAGGHITAGNVRGDALLHTEGGHIQVGRVQGAAQLITGGGNITAARAGDGVVAETTGGRIEFGEAAGAIHARTGGGGVRIAKVAGPTQLDSTGGGIFLAGIAAPLRASTSAGAITAWFSPQFAGAAAPASSELASGQGDIVVYLPRDMALTIDALVERGAEHRIVADPSLGLKVRSEESAAGRGLRARAAMNGGGEMLHLRTGSGDIQLRFLDAESERRLANQEAARAEQALGARNAIVMAMERQSDAVDPAAVPVETPAAMVPLPASAGGFAGFARLFEDWWWGGLRVDPDEQQKRLVQAVRPEYPEPARAAGLEGDVALRVEVGADGAVKDVRVLSGNPELARAAVNAVSRWRYAPALLDRRPVAVVTMVTMAFRLR